ncbi:hypothetical protein SAMN06264364_12217 [Quadrisphaera granulorum]|uniref:WD40 repeat protein n=1 Tax=Quadrisphaera granulorum TaxID=317664 RepID=A0A315ZZG0_9ACTN|nr:hypothetical protein BXY45_12217 [Quadrisphaera granulorum]SZE97890.1 hypothetical protein SAMN06264364_12217 [Quadrisphaera granulorum]
MNRRGARSSSSSSPSSPSEPQQASPQEPLETSYRRWLRLFPRDWRRRREEEVLAVLLDAAAEGQQRATSAERADLLRAAAGARATAGARAARRAPGRTAGLVVLVVGTTLALLPATTASTVGPEALAAGLPRQLPGYSYATESVSSSPPGTALALYQQGYGVEFADFPQAVVVGAGGSVRRLDLAEGRGEGAQGDPGAMLLSPDGTRVAVGRYDAERADVAIQDLRTGEVVRSRVLGSGAVLPVAWSPDGRQLVALVLAAGFNPYGGDGGPPAGTPVVLNADGSAGPALAGAPELVEAAEWTPDGRSLLLTDEAGVVTKLGAAAPEDGSAGAPAAAPWTLPFPAGPNAWSPDGALLATSGTCPYRGSDVIPPRAPGEGITVPATGLVLVPTGGAASPAPHCLPDGRGYMAFLGWAGARTVVVAVSADTEGTETDPVPIIAVNVDTGERTRLSAIPTSGNFAVSRLQVPSAVLAGSLQRPGAAPTTAWDHGRGDLALRIAAVAALAGGVALAVAAAAAAGRSAAARLRASSSRASNGSSTGRDPGTT